MYIPTSLILQICWYLTSLAYYWTLAIGWVLRFLLARLLVRILHIRRHAPISLEGTWATKFWPDRNFAWYLAASEVNAALAAGHMQNNGNVTPTLEFRRALAKEMLENTIGLEDSDRGRPARSCTFPARLPCELVSVTHFCGAWDGATTQFKKASQKYQKHRCRNFSVCKQKTRTYCNCNKGVFLCNQCFADHKVNKIVND